MLLGTSEENRELAINSNAPGILRKLIDENISWEAIEALDCLVEEDTTICSRWVKYYKFLFANFDKKEVVEMTLEYMEVQSIAHLNDN